MQQIRINQYSPSEKRIVKHSHERTNISTNIQRYKCVPKVFSLICNSHSSFEMNRLSFPSSEDACVGFIQITSMCNDQIRVRINQLDDAVFTLIGTQIFNDGDLDITHLEFDNSCNDKDTVIQVIASIKTMIKS